MISKIEPFNTINTPFNEKNASYIEEKGLSLLSLLVGDIFPCFLHRYLEKDDFPFNLEMVALKSGVGQIENVRGLSSFFDATSCPISATVSIHSFIYLPSRKTRPPIHRGSAFFDVMAHFSFKSVVLSLLVS